jgi:hypothetical protein
LKEAKRRNILTPPYGRPPNPTPLITEDEYIKSKDDLDDEPKFNFDYGFNPLRFLADYIKWSHPDSTITRKRERYLAMKLLIDRVTDAKKVVNTADEEKRLSERLKSGIVYGPITTSISSTSVVVCCKVSIAGEVLFEISEDSSFSNALTRKVQTTVESLSVKAIFDDLKENTKYYVRCSFSDEEYLKLKVIEAEKAAKAALEASKAGGRARKRTTIRQSAESEIPSSSNAESETPQMDNNNTDTTVVDVEKKPLFTGAEGGLFSSSTFITLPPVKEAAIDAILIASNSYKPKMVEKPILFIAECLAQPLKPSNQSSTASNPLPASQSGQRSRAVSLQSMQTKSNVDSDHSKECIWEQEREIGVTYPDLDEPADVGAAMFSEDISVYNCVLGDIYSPTNTEFNDQIARLLTSGVSSCLYPDSLIQKSLMFFAWNDSMVIAVICRITT